MRVMKFISLAVILVVISTLAVAQQAPAQTAPTVKHVPISQHPVELRERDVQRAIAPFAMEKTARVTGRQPRR